MTVEKPSISSAMPSERATKLFGREAYLDPSKFAEGVKAEQLENLKRRISQEYPAHAEALEALTSLAALKDFAAANDLGFDFYLDRAEAMDGRFLAVADVEPMSGGLAMNWSAGGVGFGQLYLHVENGKLIASADGMSRHFIRSVLLRLVDEIVIED